MKGSMDRLIISSIKPKQCPGCGSKHVIYTMADPDTEADGAVECLSCGLLLEEHHDTDPEEAHGPGSAILRWNAFTRRADELTHLRGLIMVGDQDIALAIINKTLENLT